MVTFHYMRHSLLDLATAIHRLASAIEQLIAAVTQASRETNTARTRETDW